MCCSNMGLNLKILKMSPALFAWRYIQKALRARLIISPMFLFAKTLRMVMTLWRHYYILKYTADAILFREIQCKKTDNLMFKQRFQCELGWNKVKYARITITHVCFIALTLDRSVGWCWSLAGFVGWCWTLAGLVGWCWTLTGSVGWCC